MINLNNKILIAFVLIFNTFTMCGQFSPYFKNYSTSDYEGGNKNWGASGTDDGRIFIANDKGLIEFDGVHWTLWQLPNKSKIRSVLVKDRKVFTGSFEEFGYWEKDDKGSMIYTSLSSKDNSHTYDQEYWQIIKYKDAILFRSFTKLYSYENNQITLIPTKGAITSCDVVDNELYIFTISDGVLKLVNNRFIKIAKIDLPNNCIINSIIKTKDGELLLSSTLNGCFVFDGYKTRLWDSKINFILKDYELNHLLKLNNGNYAFGTIKNGVFITNREGEILFHIHKKGGLINNTVLDQYLSKNNQLWLCLDNGLASVDLESFSSMIYNDINGDLGAVYDVVKYKNTIYIGSNTGLYYYDEEKSALQFIEGSQGQVWDLEIFENELFCGHNSGTYLVEGHRLKKISNLTGGWVLREVDDQRNIFVQGNYTGCARYEKTKKGWSVTKISNFNTPTRFLVFEDSYTAWAVHPYKGLSRITFDKDFQKVKSVKSYHNKGIASIYGPNIYKFKNTIIFQPGSGWQKYDPVQDTIVDYNFLSKRIGKSSYIISEDRNTELAIKNEEYIYLRTNIHDKENFFIPEEYYKNRLVSGFEKASQINDSIIGLGLMDGFLLYNIKDSKRSLKLVKPSIERLELNGNNISFNIDKLSCNYKKSNIIIHISSPDSKDYFFEYKLSPNDTSWKRNDNGKLEFSNLIDGEYELSFRVSNNNEDFSIESKLEIIVNPPWYRGSLGIMIYSFLFMAIVFLLINYNKRKLRKQQLTLKKDFEKEQVVILKQKEIENEKQLNELKNIALNNELILKSKQLANTTISLARKNELLMLVKHEMLLIKNKFHNPYTYKKLINQINKSIEHQDEWELFEQSFNQIHKEFFDKLKNKYPLLSQKDLKICAFIKMDIPTKEIAPLLNISTRGVETHRYRLKKKLQLDKNVSLNDFLMNFQT